LKKRPGSRGEMEDISELPTDLAISVVPHKDIADRLRTEFDLKS
jgi:hypothetical protein